MLDCRSPRARTNIRATHVRVGRRAMRANSAFHSRLLLGEGSLTRTTMASIAHADPMRLLVISLLAAASCAGRIPTIDDVNSAVLGLRQYQTWAWAAGIGAIWADLVL